MRPPSGCPAALRLGVLQPTTGGGWSVETETTSLAQPLELPPHPGRGRLLEGAAACARALGLTHLATGEPGAGLSAAALEVLEAAAAAHPEALVMGRPSVDSRSPGSALACFWLRVQTGVHLADPRSGRRVYPLWLLEHLHWRSRGSLADTEILVKSLWAGVAVREAFLPGAREGAPPSWHDRLLRLGLNIHYTLRSVVPLPHRKIVAAGPGSPRKVSLRRPLESIRTLLGEGSTPARLGGAAALGLFLGTLPLIALHSLAVLLGATFFRLNKLAALSASQLCMPPLVPALCIEAGHFLRTGRLLTEFSLETLGHQALDRLWEWLLGSLVLAPALAAGGFGITFGLALWLQRGLAPTATEE
jgi:uncharacterized protein (DUF2062 family)